MIRICALSIHGFPEAIHGMRNPYNSWDKSDSRYLFDTNDLEKLVTEEGYTIINDIGYVDMFYAVGPKDKELMEKLVAGGPVHAKFRRMITVAMDITAPLYWWKEFDTYKVGTVANSCSTMHTIMNKEFTPEDFSCERLIGDPDDYAFTPAYIFSETVRMLNHMREKYLKEKGTVDKKITKETWWQIIQLLPSSYNQTRTVMLNYEVLSNMYHSRRNHKLDEWKDFCIGIETILPMANELICK